MRKKIEFKVAKNEPTETLLRNYRKRTLPKIIDGEIEEKIRSTHENGGAKNEQFERDPEFPDFPAKWEV